MKNKKNEVIPKKEAIKNLSDQILQENNEGIFPVSCALFDQETGKMIAKAINEKTKKQDNTHHAESIALKKIKQKYKKIIMFVTIPPCKQCLTKISENKQTKEWEIYYLSDNIRKKTDKEYIKEFRDDFGKLKKMSYNPIEKGVTLRYWYCIDKVMESFLDKNKKECKRKNKEAQENKQNIEKVYNEHKEKMKTCLKSLKMSKGQIENQELFNWYKSVKT